MCWDLVVLMRQRLLDRESEISQNLSLAGGVSGQGWPLAKSMDGMSRRASGVGPGPAPAPASPAASQLAPAG